MCLCNNVDWTYFSQLECVPVAQCTLSNMKRKPSIISWLIMWQIDGFISFRDWSLTLLKRAQGNVSMTNRSISASKLSFFDSPDCVRLLTLHRVDFKLSPVKEVMQVVWSLLTQLLISGLSGCRCFKKILFSHLIKTANYPHQSSTTQMYHHSSTLLPSMDSRASPAFSCSVQVPREHCTQPIATDRLPLRLPRVTAIQSFTCYWRKHW